MIQKPFHLCLLGAMLLLFTLPVMVQGQLYFITNNGAITITGYNGATDFVNIPDTTNGYPVTSIGTNAFYGSYIDGVTIPNSVTNIGAYAFEGNSGLTSVTIGTNVISIGDDAFAYCASLPNVMIPASVTCIGVDSFGGIEYMTNIAVSAQNTNYSSANGILFNKSQTVLVQFPAGKSGSYTIPASVTNIGNSAFDSCAYITKLTIGTNVISIGTNVFHQCEEMVNLSIGTNVTSIGDDAFIYCSSLTNVTIPGSVTNFGVNVFGACTALTNITVASQNPNYTSLNGVVFNKNQTTLWEYPVGKKGNYTISNSVTSIGPYAFFDCSYLTNLTIGNGVTNIGDYAFYGVAMISATFGTNVISIGNHAFDYCESLTNVTLPKTLASLGDYAFAHCYAIGAYYFLGNAPSADPTTFQYDEANVYPAAGTTGWGAGFAGLYVWNLQIQTSSNNLGSPTNPFEFNITGNNNLIYIVEASTNLVNWQAVQTNTLTSGSNNFSDSQWTNSPGHFYRLRSP
jgi:hypothetical protein